MRRWRRRGDDGAAAVEFALIAPILLLLTFGAIQYGYFFFQSTAVEAATRDAARTASIGGYTCAGLLDSVRTNAGVPASSITGVKVTPAVPANTAMSMTVTVTWTPTRFGLPVPFLSGSLEERAVVVSERNQLEKVACS